MKNVAKFIVSFFSVIILFAVLNIERANAETPYNMKVNDVTNKDTKIYFTLENVDSNLYSAYAVIGKTKYTNNFLFNNGNYLNLNKTYPEGTKIEIYLEYRLDKTQLYKPELVTTLIVKDAIPPDLDVPDIDVRDTAVKFETESGATVKVTYNGKEINVEKLTDTTWKALINKPVLNKKLVITSTDASGNTTKVTKKSVKPDGIFILAHNFQYKNKYVNDYISGVKSTDKIYLIVGSKKYKGTINKGKYKIKVPKIKPPKTVKIQLFDKYGNLLASEPARVYKYNVVKIGMTKSQILNSYYGKPDDISSDIFKDYTLEYWKYDYGDEMTYLNFKNGKLFDISEY